MNLTFSKKADKCYQRLSLTIQKKADKQFIYLLNDLHYPSLNTKRKQGENIWEARIDYHYRFTFIIEGASIFILSIGMHDEGLGKK